MVKTKLDRMVQTFTQPTPGGGWVTTHEDVTERWNAEEQVRDQKLQLDAALSNIGQGLLMFDAEARLIFCNRGYMELYDLTPEEVKPGTTLQTLLECRKAKGTFRLDPDTYVARTSGCAAGGTAGDADAAARRWPDHLHRKPPDGGRPLGLDPRGHHRATAGRKAAARAEAAARHRAQQHDAGPQHVRCGRAPRRLQRALSPDVRPVVRHGEAGLHGPGPGAGAHRQRHVLRDGRGKIRHRSRRGDEAARADRGDARSDRRPDHRHHQPADARRHRLGGDARGRHRAPPRRARARPQPGVRQHRDRERAGHHRRQGRRRPALPADQSRGRALFRRSARRDDRQDGRRGVLRRRRRIDRGA